MFLVILFSLLLVEHKVNSAEILMVFPVPSYSHYLIPLSLSSKLIERGHHVTSISPYPQKAKLKNFVDIDVSDNIALLDDYKKELLDRNKISFFEDIMSIFDIAGLLVNETVRHSNVQALLQSNKKFDVIIIDNFLSESLLGLGLHFNAPVIYISAIASNTLNNYLVGNPEALSYIPHVVSASATNMDFCERIKNIFSIALTQMILFLYHLPRQREIFNSYTTGANFDDVLHNASLIFTNSHPSISPAKPLVPNIIEIGGSHINPKPLPDDLQKYLDDSKNGVILFSMGSNLNSEDLKPDVRQGILKAFSKLKQNVLWKFETNLPEATPNVKIMKWLPQQDILRHPNVKALITHGGRLSTIETIYYGVPIIGIPVFADQLGNVAQAVVDGYAVQIELDKLSEKTLSAALDEILNNPKYTVNAQHRSKIMNDQPLTPIDTAVFWVEHVIRHKGAPYRKSVGLNLAWCQREMIDIVIFFVIVFSLIKFLLLKLFVVMCQQIKKTTANKSNVKKRQ